MSQRELPPVRISFIADTTQFNKASDAVLKKVQKVADSATKIQSVTAGAASIKMAVQTAVGLMQRHLAYAAQQLVSTIHTVSPGSVKTDVTAAVRVIRTALQTAITNMVGNLANIRVASTRVRDSLRSAMDVVVIHLLDGIRRLVANVHTVSVNAAAVNTMMTNAINTVVTFMGQHLARMVAGLGSITVTSSNLRRAVRDAIRVGSQAIATVVQATFAAAAASLQGQAVYVAQVTTRLQSTLRQVLMVLLRLIHANLMTAARNLRGRTTQIFAQFSNGVGTAIGTMVTRLTRSAIAQINRTRARAGAAAPPITGGGGGGGGRGGGMGNDLGARADIYMHGRAIAQMQRFASSIFDTYMNYQDLNVAIGAFTGGATSAAKVMKEIEDYAIASPYDTLTLAEGARNMMAYGQSAQKTMEIMKMVGDVAGGSAKRYDLLMYAMSQITSLGKLQGNELRQLTEQGFNPLVYWAERTKGANESMEDAMRRMYKAKADGLVTSDHVIEALKAETSQGGRFHKLAEMLNGTLRGLGNQVSETSSKISRMFLSYLEPSAKRSLKYILELQKSIVAFMQEPGNAKIVAQIAAATQAAFLAIVGFHALGLALAVSRWWLHSLGKTFYLLLAPVRIAYGTVLLFVRAMMLLRYAVAAVRTVSIATAAAISIMRITLLAAAAATQILMVASFAFASISFAIQAFSRASVLAIFRWFGLRSATVAWTAALWLQRAAMVVMLSVTYAVAGAQIVFARAMIASSIATQAGTSALRTGLSMWGQLNRLVMRSTIRVVTNTLAWVVWTGMLLYSAIAIQVWAYAMAAAAVAGRIFQGVGMALRGVMVALRIAAALAWLAALWPIPLIIAGVGIVALAIWGVVSAVSGSGGLTNAFTSAWETIKWFATAAWGFMSNFGENMQILSKYVYDNWWTMLTDLGRMFMGVLNALPGNFLVALRTGTRLLVTFGGWLGSYLPGAFKTAYNKIYSFLSDFFTNLISISKRVWEYISNPTQWGNTAVEKEITAFMDTLRDDVNTATTHGIGTAMTDILTEEMANLRTGLEGFESSLPPIELNLKARELDMPEKLLPDPTEIYKKFGNMFNPFAGEEGKGTKDSGPLNAMSVHSGEFRRKMAEFNASGAKAPVQDQILSENKTQTGLLGKIADTIGKIIPSDAPANLGAVP